MPIIPKAQAGSQLRTSGASISQAAAGAVGQAVSSLGGVAAGIGFEAIERKKQADDAVFVTEQTNKILREETEKQAGIETRGDDVNFDDLNSEYQERLNAALENAPSEEAANEVRRQADTFYSRKFFPGYSAHQSKLNVGRRVNAVEAALDDINSEVLTGRTGVAEALARSEAAITGLAETSGGVVDIGKLRSSTGDSIVQSHLFQRIDEGKSRSVLKEINDGKWDKLATTATIAKMQSKAKADIKQRDALAKANYATGLDDYIAFLSSGNEDDALEEKFSPSRVLSVFGDKGEGLNEQIQDAKDFGRSINEIKTASPEEISALIEREKPTSPENFRRESTQLNILTKAILARNKSIADDPAAYVNQNSDIAKKSLSNLEEAMQSGDPAAIKVAASSYTEVQKAVQTDLGIPARAVQLIPKPMENIIAQQMNDMTNGGEVAVNTVNTYKQAFGKDWPKVQSQLASNKKIGESAQLIAMTPEGPGQTVVAEALSTPENELKEFIGDDSFKEIKEESFGALEDLRGTLRVGYGDSGTRSANMVQRGVERTAMKLIAEGVTSDPDDAIEQAKDIIIGDMELYDTYRVPKVEQPDLVDEGVSALRVKVLNGEFPLLAPPSREVTNPQDVIDVYLRSTSITPITTLDGTGVAFVDNKNNVLRSPDGSPLEFKWSVLRDEGSNSEAGL